MMRGIVPFFLLAVMVSGCLSEPADEVVDEDAAAPESPLIEPTPLPESLAWSRLADATVARAEHWAAEVDGKVYVIGGFVIATPLWEVQPHVAVAGGPFAPTALVEVYDIATDSWSLGVDYPGPVDHHPTIAYNGVIYVFKEPAGDAAGSFYKFDPKVGEWEAFPSAPNNHNAGTVGIIGDRIYVAGNSDKVSIFDPQNETWESVDGAGDLPTSRNHLSGAAVHGKLYAAAGDTAGHAVNTEANEEFDPVTRQWTSKAPIPVVRGSTTGVAWNDRVVLMGGQSGQEGTPAYPNVDAYDPVTDTWTALPDLPVGRHGAASVAVDGAIYIFGGAPLQGIYGFAQTHVLQAV